MQEQNTSVTLPHKWKVQQSLNTTLINEMYEDVERFMANELIYLLAPHASLLQTDTLKFNQDFVGPLVIDSVLDDTHYLLKDPDGRKLPDVYHINRLKRGRVQTSTGVAENYDELRAARVQASALPPVPPAEASLENYHTKDAHDVFNHGYYDMVEDYFDNMYDG